MAEAENQKKEAAEAEEKPEQPPLQSPHVAEQAAEEQKTPLGKEEVHEYDRILDPEKRGAIINEGDVGQQFIGEDIRFGSYVNIGKYKEEQSYVTHNTNAANITQSETATIYNIYHIHTPSRQGLAEDTRSDTQAAEAGDGQSLPSTPEQLGKWFYALEDFDQCFVQAMALFDGSTVKEVMNAARRLYSRRAERNVDASAQNSANPPWLTRRSDPQEMMRRTYVKPLRLEKSQRCQWIDTDAQGNSLFKTRILSLLVNDMRFWRESDFYDQLLVWANHLVDENMSSALQALGAISWHDKQDLEQMAQNWAIRKTDWYRASSFLLGAYTLDLQEYGEERAHHPYKSPVLPLLQKWSQQALTPGRAYPACAAALTYALLGTTRPRMAFDGLENLLKQASQNFTPYEDDEESFPEKLYETIVMAYPFLADMGYLRLVLEYLAQQATRLVYERSRSDLSSMKQKERERYHREQWLRQVRTDIILDAFYNIAIESLRRQKKTSWLNYPLDKPLPEYPSLRSSEGRETLLAGLLIPSEDAWQSHICSLLCALLATNAREAACDLLRQWAELILKDQGPSPDQTRLRYLQFLLKVVSTGIDWTQRLQSRNIKAPDVLPIFQRELGRWQKEGQRRNLPLALFAQDALDALAASTNHSV